MKCFVLPVLLAALVLASCTTTPGGGPSGRGHTRGVKLTVEQGQRTLSDTIRDVGAAHGGNLVAMHGLGLKMLPPLSLGSVSEARYADALAEAVGGKVHEAGHYRFLYADDRYLPLLDLTLAGQAPPIFEETVVSVALGDGTQLMDALAILSNSVGLTIVADNAVADARCGELVLTETPLRVCLEALLQSARIPPDAVITRQGGRYLFFAQAGRTLPPTALVGPEPAPGSPLAAALARDVRVALPRYVEPGAAVSVNLGARSLSALTATLTAQLGLAVTVRGRARDLPVNPCILTGVTAREALDLIVLQWPTDAYGYAVDGEGVIFRAVVDDAPPEVAVVGKADMVLECGARWEDPGAEARDNIDGDLSGALTVTGRVDTSKPGTYKVYYRAADTSGNAAPQAVRTITVRDTTPPVIALEGDNPCHLTAGEPWLDPGATASDRCDGAVAVSVEAPEIDTAVPGSYVVTYAATDAAGNRATLVRTVNVVDAGTPVIALLGDAAPVVECGTAWADPGVTASDNVDGDITARVRVTGAVDSATPGTCALAYDVADTAGNAAPTVTRKVTVRDTTPPVITLNGANPANLIAGNAWTDPGATASDTCDGALAATAAGQVNTGVPGAYVITYTATDAAGNAATATRTVHVNDGGAPVITLLGEAAPVVDCGGAWTDPGVTASDNVDGDITARVRVTGAVDTGAPGTYTLAYDVADTAGNAAATVTRKVTVRDTAPPTITLNGPPTIELRAGEPWNEPGASATDHCDSALPAVNVDSSQLNTAEPGRYTVTYTVTDAAGNPTTATRTITVTASAPDPTSAPAPTEPAAPPMQQAAPTVATEPADSVPPAQRDAPMAVDEAPPSPQ